MELLPVDATTAHEQLREVVRRWVERSVPASWREAARRGGAAEIRRVRSRADYENWYPVFAASGMVVPNWPVEYGGLGLSTAAARVVEEELAPYNLGRLNPLGLNLAAPALYAHGSDEQRRRFLPPIVRAEELWCQLFSEPGAGSDLAALSTRAVRDGDQWLVTGQKVWTTWAQQASFGVLLARTDPGAPKNKGITYFLLDMRQPGVEVRPLRHIGGEAEFNEVFLSGAVVPDAHRVGQVHEGWRVAGATLSGERQMVSGSASGGVDRIGGSSVTRLVGLAREVASQVRGTGWDDAILRDRLMHCYCEEQARAWTNLRVRASLAAGQTPGPASSIGKVHQGELNQRVQSVAVDLLGVRATAWSAGDPAEAGPEAWAAGLPFEVRGMLRSRANTIEGGTSEINRNILAERVLGLPREPDPWHGVPWQEVPKG